MLRNVNIFIKFIEMEKWTVFDGILSISLYLLALENLDCQSHASDEKPPSLRGTVQCEKIFIKVNRTMAEKTCRLSIRMRTKDGNSAEPPAGLDMRPAGSIANTLWPLKFPISPGN